MPKEDFFDSVHSQREIDEPAAMAMIVRREAPSSGKPGDKAVITKKGEVKGWIGGGCTKGIVIKEALEAIEQQTPRLVRIQPNDQVNEQSGVKNYRMTCMSGGTVEVYIEPIMQVTKIHLFGRSHISKAICDIGRAAGYYVNIISDLADDVMFPSANKITKLSEFKAEESMARDYMIVCTQGEDDEKSVQQAIHANPRYLSFVSSKKKANSVFLYLKREGVEHKDLVRIKTPAGIDINAKTPEEVAISILAEIVKEKRSEEAKETDIPALEKAFEEEQNELYINPVCKIPVQKSTAKHVVEYEGEKVYFCCDGCKVSFEKEPAAYIN